MPRRAAKTTRHGAHTGTGTESLRLALKGNSPRRLDRMLMHSFRLQCVRLLTLIQRLASQQSTHDIKINS